MAGLGVAAVAGVVWWLGREDTVEARCAAELDGTRWYLGPAQADNAALLAGTALQRGLPARAVTVAIATALQESKLINIDYGDRDSLGLFQQRPSQGWGTVEQVMDPVHATGAFYDALVRVDGWQDMAVTEAAQAVQRSAFPDAYAQHETRARAWASGLTGWSPAVVTCTLPEPDAAGAAEALAARLARDLGPAVTVGQAVPVEGGVAVDLDASALVPEDPARAAWAVGQWAVAVAAGQQVTEVTVADRGWTRAGAWQPAGTPAAAGTARVTLAG